MAVKFNLVQRGNPGKPSEPKKWYATAKADGEVTFKSLSREVAGISTTVSDTDVLAVLNDLTKLLVRHLSEGRIVRFGDFGAFQVSLSSKGVEEEEKFNTSLIKDAKITFRPGEDLRNMLSTVKFEKYGK